MRYRPLADRYWEKVEKRGPDECWPWKASTYPDGYGCIGLGRDYGGINRGAHRVAWFLATGEWPPDDLEVCHSCDDPPCQNPRHLFLGTHKDNMDDRDAKGRVPKGERAGAWQSGAKWTRARGDLNGARTHPETRARGERHAAAKLTEEQVLEIRRRYEAEKRHGIKAQLGREFGVDEVNIGEIVRGTTWKHLLPGPGETRSEERRPPR